MSVDQQTSTPLEVCSSWILRKTKTHLNASDTHISKFSASDSRSILTEFIESHKLIKLFFFISKDELIASKTLPKTNNKSTSIVYLVKTKPVALTPDIIAERVVCGQLPGNDEAALFDQVALLADIALKNLTVQDHHSSGPVLRDCANSLDRFITKVNAVSTRIDGGLLLSIPAHVYNSVEDDGDVGSDVLSKFELYASGWSRQIATVLPASPDSVGGGISAELLYWQRRADALHYLGIQLDKQEMINIITIMKQGHSSIAATLEQQKMQIQHSLLEARDNSRYLKPLAAASSGGGGNKSLADASKITELLHTLLLISQHSQYYNTPTMIAGAMKRLCFEFIQQATVFIPGSTALHCLVATDDSEDDADSNSSSVVVVKTKLRTVLCTLGALKSSYLDVCRQTSTTKRPWPTNMALIFSQLDAFLSRVHDVLQVVEAQIHFDKLQDITLGGVAGKELTTSARQLYLAFKAATDKLQLEYSTAGIDPFTAVVVTTSSTHHDTAAGAGTDNSSNKAMTAWYNAIKDVDHRLATLLKQAYATCPTVDAVFKLHILFDGLVQRPLVCRELEAQQILVIKSCRKEMQQQQGKISRGYKERVKGIMEGLNTHFSGAIMASDEGRELQRLAATLSL